MSYALRLQQYIIPAIMITSTSSASGASSVSGVSGASGASSASSASKSIIGFIVFPYSVFHSLETIVPFSTVTLPHLMVLVDYHVSRNIMDGMKLIKPLRKTVAKLDTVNDETTGYTIETYCSR